MNNPLGRWLFSLSSLFLAGVSVADTATLDVDSFEAEALGGEVGVDGADATLVNSEGVTDGDKALRVAFQVDRGFSGIKFEPATPWDCSDLGPYRFTFDATNVGPSSVVLHCSIIAADGVHLKRTGCVPAGETTTLYFELDGENVDNDLGMREDPPSLADVGQKMVVAGLKTKADVSRIRSLSIYVTDVAEAEVLVLDNLRFTSNPPTKQDYYKELVDEFGQSTVADYDGKVGSLEELQEKAKAELAELNAGGWSEDRSRFGGWKAGPQLEATGYFRTEKLGDRWTMVDPDGYLYFATGVANVRMANLSTFTGVDFRDDSVRYRDPADVTPEDSLDHTPSSEAARATAYVAHPNRRKLFTWLPEYTDPLAKHYGYRRSAHIGPYPHGEVFAFYRANLERRYGGGTIEGVMENWRDVTVKRMKDWGFTCTGNWTDASYYQMNRLPYFANGWIIGDFKTVSSGEDYWGPMPDPFDPEFARRARSTVETIAEEVKGNPWCVGVFIDNEKSWGSMNSTHTRFGIIINALSRDTAECPTKAMCVETLQAKYKDIAALNEAWGIDIGSWEAFAKGFAPRHSYDDPEMLNDFSKLSLAYCDEYFRTVHDLLEEIMPNHMYLGCRMAPWAMTGESREAATRYCDMMSYNFYHESLGERVWDFLPYVDKPSIIGEWHMGARDAGHFHPGIIHAANQEDRGKMYTTYMDSVAANPYFVGAHWFQYIDSPITGRPHDGENYNVGFVNVADVPYKPLVDAAKAFNEDLYERVYGEAAKNVKD